MLLYSKWRPSIIKKRLTIQVKIISLALFILVALLTFVIVVHSRVNELQQETNVITHQDREITSLVNQIEKNILDMETGQRGFIITGEDKYLEPYQRGLIDLQSNYDQLLSYSSEGSIQASRLVSLKENVNKWIASSNEPLIALKRQGQDQEIVEQYQTDISINQMNQIRSQINEYRQVMNTNTDNLIANQAERNKLLIELLYLAWAGIALVALTAAWFISRTISTTILNISESINNVITSKNTMTRIKISSNDEISDLGHITNELLGLQQERMELQEHTNMMLAEYHGIKNIEELSEIFLGKMAEKLNYPYGTLYVRRQESEHELLVRTASYAGHGHLNTRDTFQTGEGLVGQCAKEAKMLQFEQVPENYVQILSSLGTSSPQFLMLSPICFMGKVLAVVEIATFKPLTPVQVSYLESVTEDFGAAINSTLGSMKVDNLLEGFQRMNEELQVTTEELQAQSEELQMQTESLQKLNDKLEERQIIADEKTLEAQQAQAEMSRYAGMLEQSSRYKSEFLANMSHELRTPLNGILLLSEFLKENSNSSLTMEELEYAQAIHSSGHDLLVLINDILDLSKVEAGKLNIEIDAVNVSEIPESVLQNFEPISKRKEVELRFQIDPDLPSIIYTDGHRLKQIINNLLSNAFKFTSEGYVQLEIRMASNEETERLTATASNELFIAFSVQDTGIGIDEDKQQLVFDAFQQAERETERLYGGTGLGLSITNGLTLLLGGRVYLHSEVGVGSTFTVYLPVDYDTHQSETKQVSDSAPVLLEAAPLIASTEPAEASGEINILQNKYVLIVDDDDRNLFALSKVLKAHGLKISVARDGQEALNELQNALAVDFILMDIMMPIMDGYEAIQQIRLIPQHAHVPIIALTARAMMEDRTRIINVGATEYMSKPVNMEQLLALMKMLLFNK